MVEAVSITGQEISACGMLVLHAARDGLAIITVSSVERIKVNKDGSFFGADIYYRSRGNLR